jgi:hypothetical protein
MHYWNLLWNWNIVESVRVVHSFFEGWALVFFALLVLFDVLAHLTEDGHKARSKTFERIGLWCFGVAVIAEILAYPYSRRNDTLSSQQDATQKATIARLENSTQGLKTDAQHSKERSDKLETGLETERQKTARFQENAETARLALVKEIGYIGEQQQSRHVVPACVNSFTGRPKARAEIRYIPNDVEAFVLAEQLYDCLGTGPKDKPGAGWSVSRPEPIPDNAVLDPKLTNAPEVLKAGGSWGVSIISRDLVSSGFNTALSALELGVSVGIEPRSGLLGSQDTSLPADLFIVIVGPKPPIIPWSVIPKSGVKTHG